MQVCPNHPKHPLQSNLSLSLPSRMRRPVFLPAPRLHRLAAVLSLLVFSAAAQAATLNVPSAQYPSIQSAITAASVGDTIQVAAGLYPESLDWKNKDLTIIGEGTGQSVVDPSRGNGGRCLFTTGLTAASHLNGFTFQNGNEFYGGGMCNTNSSPTVSNCAFSGNTASLDGGGISNQGNSSPSIANCTFSGNTAVSGGGISNSGLYNQFIYNNSPSITNCIFSGNTGSQNGGGIYNRSNSSPRIINCTISGNTAVNNLGGGMLNFNNGNPTVINCIVWGNSASSGNGIVNASSSPTVTYSDVQDLSNATPDTNGNFAADPRFVDAVNGNLHLQATSPCIDAGDDTVVTVPPFPADANGNPLDLADNPRISGAHVNLGAYEYTPNKPPVTNAGGNRTIAVAHDGDPTTNTANVTLDGSQSSDPEGDSLTYRWTDAQGNMLSKSSSLSLTLTPGTYSYTLRVTDTYGASTSQSVTVIVNPEPNQAPVTNAGSSQMVEGQGATTRVTLNGSQSSDPDNDPLTYRWSEGSTTLGTSATVTTSLPYGTHTLTLIVTDPYGASSHATVTINIVDTTAPTITASASQTQLWPPNGKTVPVVVSGKVTDCGTGIDLTSGSYVVHDSEGTVQPTGTFTLHADGTYSASVPLVASRNGNNQAGRTYTITVSVRDKAGNVGKTTVTVTVPHDQGH